MGKIFYIMGKSSTGKDTIYRKIGERFPQLKSVTLYTTRPIRKGEEDGVQYFFVDEKRCDELVWSGKVIELRAYQTVHGIWKYFTLDDGQIDTGKHSYLMIGTLESYEKMKVYLGGADLVPLYIEVDDGDRLERALRRERKQENPKYAELCRRFLADTEDFSDEKIERAGIERRFENAVLENCMDEIIDYISSQKCGILEP